MLCRLWYFFFFKQRTAYEMRISDGSSDVCSSDLIGIPGLDGRKHDIAIPAGIQSGKQLRQRGAGMPVLNGRGHGDLVVQIDVETPTKLTARQKELLAEFRETETGEECPASQGFFGRIKEMWDDLTDCSVVFQHRH